MNKFLLLVALVPSIAYFLGAFPTRPFLGESGHTDKADDLQRFSLSYVSSSHEVLTLTWH